MTKDVQIQMDRHDEAQVMFITALLSNPAFCNEKDASVHTDAMVTRCCEISEKLAEAIYPLEDF